MRPKKQETGGVVQEIEIQAETLTKQIVLFFETGADADWSPAEDGVQVLPLALAEQLPIEHSVTYVVVVTRTAQAAEHIASLCASTKLQRVPTLQFSEVFEHEFPVATTGCSDAEACDQQTPPHTGETRGSVGVFIAPLADMKDWQALRFANVACWVYLAFRLTPDMAKSSAFCTSLVQLDPSVPVRSPTFVPLGITGEPATVIATAQSTRSDARVPKKKHFPSAESLGYHVVVWILFLGIVGCEYRNIDQGNWGKVIQFGTYIAFILVVLVLSCGDIVALYAKNDRETSDRVPRFAVPKPSYLVREVRAVNDALVAYRVHSALDKDDDSGWYALVNMDRHRFTVV